MSPQFRDRRDRRLRSGGCALLAWAFAAALAAPAPAQQPSQEIQFAVRLPGEGFDRFCPATPIAPIAAKTGAAVSFSATVLATAGVEVTISAQRPDGQPASLSELDVLVTPPPPFLTTPGGDEMVFFWVPTNAQSGAYRFELTARDPASDRFSTCPIVVDVERGCALLDAVDLEDGDADLDFGEVAVGARRTGSIGVVVNPEANVAEPIGFCPVPNPDFQIAIGSIADLLAVTFAPGAVGDSASTAVVYHPSDVAGDPCLPGAAEANECIREVRLSGTATAPQIAARFANPLCGRTTVVELTVENQLPTPLRGLRAVARPPLTLVPQGPFEISDFELGPVGATEPPSSRMFRVEIPAEEPVSSSMVEIVQGEAALLAVSLPELGCPIVAPEVIDFGDVDAGLTGSAFIAVSNPGDAAFSINAAIVPTDLGFTIEPQEFAVQPGETGILEAVFAPRSSGLSLAEAVLTSDDPPSAFRIPLAGFGLAPPSPELTLAIAGEPVLSGAEVRLPASRVGETSSVVLTLSNRGLAPVRNLSFSSSNADFSATPAEVDSVPSGQSVEISILFTPSRGGTSESRLDVSADGVDGAFLRLTGEGERPPVDLTISVPESVEPGQFSPFPSLALTLAQPAADRLAGEIVIAWSSVNELPADPALRFVNAGTEISFEVAEGSTQAVFGSEQDSSNALFQVGTVSGWIDFTLVGLRDSAGDPVPVVSGAATASSFAEAGPPTASATSGCESVGAGVLLSVRGFSPNRRIDGVELRLQAAPGAELQYAPPDSSFANQAFETWFSSPDSLAYGGAFRLLIPVDLSNPAAYGGAEIRLRNALGWSQLLGLPAESCR